VKQEDVDVVENYFSEGYRRNSQAVVHHNHQGYGGGEERVPESRISWNDQRQYSIDEQDQEAQMIQYDDDVGNFDDLILVEEDAADSETSPQINPSRSTDSAGAPQPKPKTNYSTKAPPASSLPSINTDQTTEVVVRPPASTSPTTIRPPARNVSDASSSSQGQFHARGTPHFRARQYAHVEGGDVVDYGTQDDPDLDQIMSNVATGVSKNISRIGRINLADGWDVGTSPQEKCEDLCLGLRDGLCGALSSFSSWLSAMIHLFQAGQIGQAFVGLMLGIQLPIIAYRFGQYVSVYIFVWRCRREKRRDERRGGYGIQLHMDEEGSFDDINESATNRSHHSGDSVGETSAATSPRTSHATRTKGRKTVHEEDSEVPSVRAIVTALFIMCLVAQITSLNFFYKPKQRLLAFSLLFSPLGVLARWRMMKFNAWRPNFPIGTFAW
jgi:fluoride ion exporter CrcB/FEX